MSQQYPPNPPFEHNVVGNSPLNPQHPSSQEHKAPKRRRWPWITGLVVAFFVGLTVGAVSGGGVQPQSAPGTTVTTVPGPGRTVIVTATPKSEAPKVEIAPKAADFKLTVKTLTKQCFGSAGCNVTYRILVAYEGPELDTSKTYEVLYEVRGGEDGPVANKLTVEDGQSSVDEEEMVSTASSRTKLTAVVTDVLE